MQPIAMSQRTSNVTPTSWSASPPERRRQRSPYLVQALHHQLAYVQSRLSLEAIVLTDDLGQVVAWAGERELARRLGDEAPWLAATPDWDMPGAVVMLWDVRPGLKPEHIQVRRVRAQPFGERLTLCAIGDSPYLADWMKHAARGVHRIAATA